MVLTGVKSRETHDGHLGSSLDKSRFCAGFVQVLLYTIRKGKDIGDFLGSAQ